MVGTPTRGSLNQFKSRRRSIFNRPSEILAKTTDNNKDLIDALDKCKTSRANADKSKHVAIAENLKFMEEIAVLKRDKKLLEQEIKLLRSENIKLENERAEYNPTSDKNIVKVLQKLLCVHQNTMPSQYDSPQPKPTKSVDTPENNNMRMDPVVPDSLLTPESDSECFTRVADSNMSDSPISIVKAKDKVTRVDTPTLDTTPSEKISDSILLVSPDGTPDLFIVKESSFDSSPDEAIKENVPLDIEKTQPLKKKLARTSCVTPHQSNPLRPRETPSRSTKAAVNYAEPKVGTKLRRGDSQSMKFIKDASSRL